MDKDSITYKAKPFPVNVFLKDKFKAAVRQPYNLLYYVLIVLCVPLGLFTFKSIVYKDVPGYHSIFDMFQLFESQPDKMIYLLLIIMGTIFCVVWLTILYLVYYLVFYKKLMYKLFPKLYIVKGCVVITYRMFLGRAYKSEIMINLEDIENLILIKDIKYDLTVLQIDTKKTVIHEYTRVAYVDSEETRELTGVQGRVFIPMFYKDNDKIVNEIVKMSNVELQHDTKDIKTLQDGK